MKHAKGLCQEVARVHAPQESATKAELGSWGVDTAGGGRRPEGWRGAGVQGLRGVRGRVPRSGDSSGGKSVTLAPGGGFGPLITLSGKILVELGM